MRMSTIGSMIALLLFAGSFNVNAQRVTVTLTGDGNAGFAGDGGSCKLAEISGPKDICMDASQNIYFVDKANGRIRKISAQKGVITTIGGGGSSTADGIVATTASLTPNYMCISTGGTLYFTTDNRIRKINTSGIVTTIAGSTTAGYSGDGALAVSASLNTPEGICIDASNNIFFVDRGNNCIRKIDGTTGKIFTIAGNGTAGLSGDGGPATAALLHGPVCVAVDATGNIYFSDQNPNYPGYDNSIIRKIAASTTTVSTIAGQTPGSFTFGVPANQALLGTITGICIGGDGNLYCCEMSCSCRMLHFSTDTLELLGGNFYAQGYQDDINSTLADMNIPYGLCVDRMGSVYVADSNNQRIRKLVAVEHAPAFAYNHGQYINPTGGTTYPLDSLLWITDIDSAQTETWTVIRPPMHGTLAGFPATTTSLGYATTTKAYGLSYTPGTSYSGADVFRVRVSDGFYADTMTIYVGPSSGAGLLSVANISNVAGISVFPNPATSTLNIAWSNMQEDHATVNISDAAGRSMYRSVLENSNSTGTTQVDIAQFPAGTYFVTINGSDTKKFVKE